LLAKYAIKPVRANKITSKKSLNFKTKFARRCHITENINAGKDTGMQGYKERRMHIHKYNPDNFSLLNFILLRSRIIFQMHLNLINLLIQKIMPA
jgi:hypothetical protein